MSDLAGVGTSAGAGPVRTHTGRRTPGPPLTVPAQMNIASACISARYSEVQRMASRGSSANRGRSSPLPRKGSPASRPRPDSPVGTPRKTPAAPSSVASACSGSAAGFVRSPSPRQWGAGGGGGGGGIIPGQHTQRRAHALRERAGDGGQLTPRRTTRSPSSGMASVSERESYAFRHLTQLQLRESPSLTALKSAYSAASPSPAGTPPAAASTPPAVQPSSSFDYLAKAAGGGGGGGDGRTTASSAVSPLVASLQKQMQHVEAHISDSLFKSRLGAPPPSASLRRSAAAPPPHLPPRSASPAFRHASSATHRTASPAAVGGGGGAGASDEFGASPATPATSLRHVSPPRRVVPGGGEGSPGAAATAAVSAAATPASLETLHTELGRVRVGLGAARGGCDDDWEWGEESPAAGMAGLLVSAHASFGDALLASVGEAVDVAWSSCSVFRAQALVRDLGVAAAHAREMERALTDGQETRSVLKAEVAKAHQTYVMRHPEVGHTTVTLKSDGTHDSPVGGSGAYTLSSMTLLGNLVPTLTLSYSEGHDVLLTSSDLGVTWKGLPSRDTVELLLNAGGREEAEATAAAVQPWLSQHIWRCEAENQRAVNEEAARREAKLRAQIAALERSVTTLSIRGGGPAAAAVPSASVGTQEPPLPDAPSPSSSAGDDDDDDDAAAADVGGGNSSSGEGGAEDEGAAGQKEEETFDGLGMDELLDRAQRLRKDGEDTFCLALPAGESTLDTPTDAPLLPGGSFSAEIEADLLQRELLRKKIEDDVEAEKRLLELEIRELEEQGQQALQAGLTEASGSEGRGQ